VAVIHAQPSSLGPKPNMAAASPPADSRYIARVASGAASTTARSCSCQRGSQRCGHCPAAVKANSSTIETNSMRPSSTLNGDRKKRFKATADSVPRPSAINTARTPMCRSTPDHPVGASRGAGAGPARFADDDGPVPLSCPALQPGDAMNDGRQSLNRGRDATGRIRKAQPLSTCAACSRAEDGRSVALRHR